MESHSRTPPPPIYLSLYNRIKQPVILPQIPAVNTTLHLLFLLLSFLFTSSTAFSIISSSSSSLRLRRLADSTMSSVFQSFKKHGLPVSQPDSKDPGLRRRLSSLSFNIQPICSAPSSWRFPRSKSMPSMGEFGGSSVRKWWDWGWAWILTRKPGFAKDLEMNEEETAILGCHSKGSWRHVFYKVRSELRRLVGSDHVGLPQTCRYDSYSYSQNFDNGNTAAIHG